MADLSIFFHDHQCNEFVELSTLLGEEESKMVPIEEEHHELARGQNIETISNEIDFLTSSPAPSSTISKVEDPARVSPLPSLRTQSPTLENPFVGPFIDLQQSESAEETTLSKITTPSEETTNKRKIQDQYTQSVSEDDSNRASRQKIRRRERNREHAKRSRSKKKDLTKQLEETVAMLREENYKLKQSVSQQLKVGLETTQRMMQSRNIASPADKFISSLKKPTNRILNDSTIAFLKSLGQDCQLQSTKKLASET